jgi:hypothetical protein
MFRTGIRLLALACCLGLAASAAASTTTASSFEDLDKNADGLLSREEAAAEKGLDFAKADTDKNGWLDRAEYEAAVS